MPTVILVRHGQSTANAAGILAGRSAGVTLDATGERQVAALAAGFAALNIPLADVVSSPMERCVQTARVIRTGEDPRTDERLIECDYGDWTGKSGTDLRQEGLWQVVQEQPSAATFPGGESLRDMQYRAVEAVREHDARIAREHGHNALWAAVSHGDLIKSVIADALGLHLDLFQRIMIDTCSVSAIAYGEPRPSVLRINAGSPEGLVPQSKGPS